MQLNLFKTQGISRLLGRRRAFASRTMPPRRGREVSCPERLEDRRVMAFDLVSAYSASGDAPFYQTGGTTQTLTEAPQQVTLRFSPGVNIDPATVGSISIVRSGGAGDAFGNGNDVAIVPGSILVNDLPNRNEVVIRFTDTLPDDSYRITVAGGAGGLKTVPGDTMATTHTVDVRLNLGAFVVSVVPQPVVRVGDALIQNRNQVDVYFNANDRLNAASAQQVGSYRLFEVDKSTGGKLKITVHANASLFKAPEIKRAVQSGQAQIGEQHVNALRHIIEYGFGFGHRRHAGHQLELG